MRFVYVQEHAAAVERLYRQRCWFLNRPSASLAGLERLEERLRVHLTAVAENGAGPDEPTSEQAAFGVAALRLLGRESGGAALALELLGEGGALARGAEEALSLLPPAAEDDTLINAYQRQPSWRAPLLRVFRRTARTLPPGLLNAATGPDAVPDLQIAALQYAAECTDAGAERFRAWIDTFQDGEAATAVLWGSLRRGDEEVIPALRRAVERADDPADKASVLRLMALSGERGFDDILYAYAERTPREGAAILALRGDADALETLCALCERPESGDEVATAWHWVTGETLPRRPRLRLISAEGETPASADEIPDAEWANGWWRQNRRRFEGGGSFLLGRPRTAASLMDACYRWAGQQSCDLLALAALHAAPTLTVDPEGWMAWRRKALARTGVPRREAPVEGWRARDGWEHGHYA